MDQPDLDPHLHRAALTGLARINSLSGSARILSQVIWQFSRHRRLTAPRIADLASGAGDLPIRLWQSGRRLGFEPRIVGWDKSPLAIEQARQRAQRCQAQVEFQCADLFATPLPGASAEQPAQGFDIVLCSLFLHHLDEPQAVKLLQRMGELSRGLVLVNDIERGPVNYLLIALASRLVTRSPVVHVDALRSSRAAFTRQEVASLARRAGLNGARVESRWPCRLLLSWSRPK